MANSTRDSPKPRHSLLVRTIAIVLLALIILVGLAVLIIWLTVQPKKLVFSIEEASIHRYGLNNNSNSNYRLNATFDFVLKAYNPNNKVSVYYEKAEMSVYYDDVVLAYASNAVDPFFQPHSNFTHLPVKLAAHDAPLPGAVATDLRGKRRGNLYLDVRMKAKIRFKVGVWKSGRHTLKVMCSPAVPFYSSKGFERTICEVEV